MRCEELILTDDANRVTIRSYHSRLSPGKREYREHHHTECELSVFLSGRGIYEVHGRRYEFGAGDVYIMDQISDTSSSDEIWLENIALKEAMKSLNDREKAIINMRFYAGKTQSEIASEIGISQAQVSRLEKSALEYIRKQM